MEVTMLFLGDRLSVRQVTYPKPQPVLNVHGSTCVAVQFDGESCGRPAVMSGAHGWLCKECT